MEKSGAVDEYGFRNNRKLILAEGFSKYFASNYENLTNPTFLIDFEIRRFNIFCRWTIRPSKDRICDA